MTHALSTHRTRTPLPWASAMMVAVMAIGGCSGSGAAPDELEVDAPLGSQARFHEMLGVELYLINEDLPDGPFAERVEIPLLTVFEAGLEEAPIVVVEIADVRCPWCARSWEANREAMAKLLKEGRVRTVFVDFPLPSHPESPDLHAWARCIGQLAGPEAFWSARDELYRMQDEIRGPEDLGSFTATLDLGRDQETLDICVSQGLELPFVQNGVRTALALEVRGTPMYYVGGLPVSGVMEGDYLLSIVERLERESAQEVLEETGLTVTTPY